jgi:hypothetical protein
MVVRLPRAEADAVAARLLPAHWEVVGGSGGSECHSFTGGCATPAGASRGGHCSVVDDRQEPHGPAGREPLCRGRHGWPVAGQLSPITDAHLWGAI